MLKSINLSPQIVLSQVLIYLHFYISNSVMLTVPKKVLDHCYQSLCKLVTFFDIKERSTLQLSFFQCPHCMLFLINCRNLAKLSFFQGLNAIQFKNMGHINGFCNKITLHWRGVFEIPAFYLMKILYNCLISESIVSSVSQHPSRSLTFNNP